ncbi:ELM1/GtrOC1 family putative glycosyltransferase [Varunaivibrio sulfuroxidans]|uniref:Nucleoside-diphosphate sugar epimerase n=1 Tax=Varunaivibrio sulfuroxidans TaxID=1773489 RepID=A0A4R3J4Q9_9PROT|nr:ELM1/GtrOC1 family putative glycosyltransferase [Varunaivibrio sulfuroxidans]TCS60859.1 hypothetical protein EDD55_10919 [Varunaivibrio sulfuroxidans]WES31727.1 ELM1/GtrOC1 family putative glycosyltransferase [Varunaivibrio sulfuroxidans]
MSEKKFQDRPPIIWLLVDDDPEGEAMVMACGRALERLMGWRFEIKELRYTHSAALPDYIMQESFAVLTQSGRVNLVAPWPDIVIATGKRSVPVERRIKVLSQGKAFLVHIDFPGAFGAEDFDLIAVARHDAIPAAENTMTTGGVPHLVMEETLHEGRKARAEICEPLGAPRLAVLVGGDTPRRVFSPQMARDFAADVVRFAERNAAALMVHIGARMSEEAARAFRDTIAVWNGGSRLYAVGDGGDDPFFGYLAWADGVIVSGENAALCCRAAGGGMPVYIHAPKKLVSHKMVQLHRDLYEKGLAVPFDADGALTRETHPPLNAAFEIAAEIKRRLEENEKG